MKEIVSIRVEKLSDLMKLSTAELKMFFIVLSYLNNQNKKILVNNAEFRNYLLTIGFSKTPERISTILSSMVKKGIIVRESQGVYSIAENLFLLTSNCKE